MRNDFLLLLILGLCVMRSALAEISGLAEIAVRNPERPATVTARVWYPAVADGAVNPPLALTGARAVPGALPTLCREPPISANCRWFSRGEIDLQAIDPALLGRSNLDARVQTAIVIDPEFTQLFSEQSLSSSRVPTFIIDSGSQPEAESVGARLRRNLPRVGHETMLRAGKFSVFPECQPRGAQVLREKEGDPGLCEDDQSGSPRAGLHRHLIAVVAGELRRVVPR